MPSTWIIPDIHGYANTLRALIETQICPVRGDELIFLGDYIDRGGDSRGVINYIRKLQGGGYVITALRGNHEAMLAGLWRDRKANREGWWQRGMNRRETAWLEMGGDATLQSFKAKRVTDIPGDYIDWMDDLGWYVLLDDFVVVHAGLNFTPADPFEDRQAMLWSRDFEIKPEKIGDRRIIHGHVPVSLEMISLAVNNPKIPFIDLDNGPYIKDRPGFGNLCALEINSMKLVIQQNVD